MGRDRSVGATPTVSPRLGRLVAVTGAVGVTLVAVLGGVGILPVEQGAAQAAVRQRPVHDDPPAGSSDAAGNAEDAALPARSGNGRRIVFDISDQRVWLVAPSGDDPVRRTYLVSGSVTDNLRPGTYSVYSKSRHAWGIEDSGTMQYMVRFAHGARAAIGFHDIPELNGVRLQTRDQLGTPQSHGCIRQWRPDARALWRFAPVGTKVVILA